MPPASSPPPPPPPPAPPPPPLESGALPCRFGLFRSFRRTHSSFSSVVSRMGLLPPLPIIPRVFPSLSQLCDRCDDLLIRGLSAELTIADVLLQPGLLSQCLQKSLIIRHRMLVESRRCPHAQFLRHSLQTSFVGL